MFLEYYLNVKINFNRIQIISELKCLPKCLWVYDLILKIYEYISVSLSCNMQSTKHSHNSVRLVYVTPLDNFLSATHHILLFFKKYKHMTEAGKQKLKINGASPFTISAI